MTIIQDEEFEEKLQQTSTEKLLSMIGIGEAGLQLWQNDISEGNSLFEIRKVLVKVKQELERRGLKAGGTS